MTNQTNSTNNTVISRNANTNARSVKLLGKCQQLPQGFNMPTWAKLAVVKHAAQSVLMWNSTQVCAWNPTTGFQTVVAGTDRAAAIVSWLQSQGLYCAPLGMAKPVAKPAAPAAPAPAAKPAPAPAPAAEPVKIDKLTELPHIAQKRAAKLYEAGVKTFAAIAVMPQSQYRAITNDGNAQHWAEIVAQAKALAK